MAQRLKMNDLRILENVPLKDFCTIGIGGPARYFIEIKTVSEMKQAIKHCQQHEIRFKVLGKGSNCLFDDRGFNGAILLNKIDFFENAVPGTFHVGAGYSFALLGVQTARKGYAGLEFASGIPASVGGAVYMNAGANGKETSEAIDSIDFVDRHSQLVTLRKEQMSFSYRKSPFREMIGAIVGATFILKADPFARKRQIEIVTYRKNTQPYDSKSAGCVFLNPECDPAGAPPTGSLPAGALIDRCGLKKRAFGGAEVSEKHGNFLINANQATSLEFKSLMELVQNSVREKTGIELKPEIHQIPYDA